MVSSPTVDDLVRDAGLDSELADVLRAEQLGTLDLLIDSSLAERREVLRALGCRYGAVLTINRVLEGYRQLRIEELRDSEDALNDDDDDGDTRDEGDDNDDGTFCAAEEAEEAEEPEEEAVPVGAAPARRTPSQIPATLRVSPSQLAQLQAAALLLGRAEVHTLKALQAMLGNVLRHPTKAAYRTIERASSPFHERVWGVPGGSSLLRAAGFVEATLPGRKAVVQLPAEAPLDPLRAAKHTVDEILLCATEQLAPAQPPPQSPASQSPTRSPTRSSGLGDGAGGAGGVGRQLAGSVGSPSHSSTMSASFTPGRLLNSTASDEVDPQGDDPPPN